MLKCLQVSLRLEEELPVLVEVKGADFEVEEDLLLCASAKLNEGAPEIREDPLHEALVQATHEANCGRIHLDVPSLVLVRL